MARAASGSGVHVHDRRQRSRARARWTRRRSTCASCRSTSARSARTRSAGVCATSSRTSAARRCTPTQPADSAAQSEAAPAPAAGARRRRRSRSSPSRSRDSVRATPGAVDVGLSTQGQKPELNVQVNRGARRHARREPRPARDSRCASRSPASTRAPGSIRRASRATSTCASPPRRARTRRTSAHCRVALIDAGTRTAGTSHSFRSAQVATITPSVGPAQINHYQRAAASSRSARTCEGASVGNVAQRRDDSA